MELSVKEVAELRGCSERYVRTLVQSRTIPHEIKIGSNGRKKYLIPLEALSPALQIKYYRSGGLELPGSLKAEKAAPASEPKPLESYTAQQREEIKGWMDILEEWQQYRSCGTHQNKALADQMFVEQYRGTANIG